VLFLVEMCEPDGSEASDTFNGALIIRQPYRETGQIAPKTLR